jgi:hypothetical protein
MSCPYTSAQNGKAERVIRTTNNIVRSLLFHASAPTFWVAALNMATHLLNILPTKTLSFSNPHFALFGMQPSYEHLRVFGCSCYPNLSATATHKLAPRSSLCVYSAIPLTTRGIFASTATQTAPLSPDTSYSMKPRFPFPPIPPYHLTRLSIFWRTTLIL